MLRKILFILLLPFICLTTYAQNGVRVYGFSQESLPGIIPKGTTESGGPVKKEIVPEYLIYLSSTSAGALPVEVYIKGKPYSIKTTTAVRTPVVQKNNVGKSVTLVPAATGTVRQLTLTHYTPGKVFSRAKAKARIYDLVVVYRLKGTYYSATLKKLTKLEPVFNE